MHKRTAKLRATGGIAMTKPNRKETSKINDNEFMGCATAREYWSIQPLRRGDRKIVATPSISPYISPLTHESHRYKFGPMALVRHHATSEPANLPKCTDLQGVAT